MVGNRHIVRGSGPGQNPAYRPSGAFLSCRKAGSIGDGARGDHFGQQGGFGVTEFRRAVQIHPHLQKIPDLIKTLTEKVEGRDI